MAGKKNKSKLEGCEREGKDDENFDEFMEGMFPGKGEYFFLTIRVLISLYIYISSRQTKNKRV